RWSRGQSAIVVPGVGQRSVVVSMDIVSHRAQWFEDAPPTVLYVQAGDLAPVPITLRQAGARYHIYVPAEGMRDGELWLELITEGWQNPVDSRENLGVALGNLVEVRGIAGSDGFVLPSGMLLLSWSGCLLLLYFMLRLIYFPRRLAFLTLLPLALLIPLLVLLNAPRLGFGNGWVWQFGALALLTAAICRIAVPPLLRRLEMVPPEAVLRWLLLLVVMSFAIKYGGRLYIASMPGDVQLHVNRYTLTVIGEIYIRAQHRGLPFPFPNGLYLLIAPLSLTGYGLHFLFELTAGIFEATAVLLMYLLVARLAASTRLGLLAAALYSLTAGGHMITWFAFETQVAGQWVTLLLFTVLVFAWPHRRDWLTWWVVVMLLIQVFLGHIGQFLNLSAAAVILLPWLWWQSRNDAEQRRGVLWLYGAGAGAAAFVSLFYYTAFWDLILEQIVGVSTRGLNDVTQRPPISREATLHTLWEGGLITHFGFFPVLLVIPGLLALWHPRWRRSIIPPLIVACFLVSIGQAVLPLITLNSITTRWLMFSSWGIFVAAAVGVLLLWRRGRSARLVSLAMAGYVCWITIVIWMDAMTLRLPPIEPF
ncbi:MAG: hypothetical protein HC893_17015, partial [Chloroflexaceae bacterium]|nr:hypothetical protein [Chloroflexaceae bacterium]